MKLIDLTGQRFGRLVVLNRAERQGRRVAWDCACDCGQGAIIPGEFLRNGDTRSCGCLHREQLASRNRTNRKPDDEIGYAAAHVRVRAAHGRADAHACVDCGQQAKDWSLRKGTPITLVGTLSTGHVCAFSPNPNDYEPRCRTCHLFYDRGREDEKAS